MPQGLRGRVALFGAGVVCCTGLVGCLTDTKTNNPPVSKAKAGVVTPPGAKTTTPDLRPVGGTGIPISGGFQPGGAGVAPAGGYAPVTGANPYNTGAITGPVVPGIQGAGAPMPGSPPIIPSLTPTPSGYPPTGPISSNVGAMPTTARGAAPTPTPPTPMLTDAPPLPPAPPGGPLSPADSMPPIAPVTSALPLAPLPPAGVR